MVIQRPSNIILINAKIVAKHKAITITLNIKMYTLMVDITNNVSYAK